MQPIAPTTPLSVTLEAQEWNAVMAATGKQPYEVVATVMQKMREQLQRGAEAVPATNGVDHAALQMG